MNDLSCSDERRREIDRRTKWNGIDWIEVEEDDRRHLCLHFLAGVPKNLKAENFVIRGGTHIRDIHVVGRPKVSSPAREDSCLDLTVDKAGDFSTYTLCIVALDAHGHPTGEPPEHFDPRYSCARFTFNAGCPTDLDCAAEAPCPRPAAPVPDIDYLAKDYASFRQLMLDRLAVLMPEWRERHVPDIGIAIVEVLAYVADYLSDYQDAVATEAYLDTARLRISVRRHARLVDYSMHEGCNARVWIFLDVSADVVLTAADVAFITPFDGSPDRGVPLVWASLAGIESDRYTVFTPLLPAPAIACYAAHDAIAIYTWGDEECCLEKGATHATLVDSSEPARRLHLAAGDFLLFEEQGLGKRHVVRLTNVKPAVDPVMRQPIVEIEWGAEDALPFPFCVSAIGPAPDCALLEGLSLARGNVVLADHGRRWSESAGAVPAIDTRAACDGEGEIEERILRAARFRPRLQRGPITFREPLSATASAASSLTQEPRRAVPDVTLRAIPPALRDAVFEPEDLADPAPLALRVRNGSDRAARTLRKHLSPETIEFLGRWDGVNVLPDDARAAFVADLRRLAVEGIQPEPLFDPEDLSNPAGLSFRLWQALDAGARTMRARLGKDVLHLIDAQRGSPDPALQKILLGLMESFLETWTAQSDLLGSTSSDRHFVAEIDDDGRAHIRFGDGDTGREPEPGTAFIAGYRAGNGIDGNVGAETITRLVFENDVVQGVTIRVRNPLPASGGRSAEPVEEVKAFAPRAFRKPPQRAITADDYALLAGLDSIGARNPDIQKAAAQLAWNGAWTVAGVVLDAAGVPAAGTSLVGRVNTLLQRYRRMGHDLDVAAAQDVPVELEIEICALPHYARGDVKRAVLDAFSNRLLPNGARGFFHPDNLTFGDGIYVSRIIAAAQRIDGVLDVQVKVLRRLLTKNNPDFADGVLRLAPFEIARLDNDAAEPDNGVLRVVVRGGR